MSVPLRLVGFVAGLVVVFAVAMGVGRSTGPVGPVGPVGPAPTQGPTTQVGTDDGH